MKLIDRPETREDQNQTPLPPSRNLKRWLSVLIAFSGAAVYGVYVTKGWSLYESIPGGRGLVLGLAVLLFIGFGAARIYAGLGKTGIARTTADVWKSEIVRTWLPVGFIVAMAFLVRVWSVNFGLPYLEQVDEWAVADRALHIIQTGNFNPLDYRNPGLPDNDRQAFTYPTLYTYLQTGVFSLKFLQGVGADVYDGTGGLSAPAIKPDFYLWGRIFTAILGAGTVLLLYFIGRKFYNHRIGMIAALFLSFFYLHILNSRFITTDVPSGFFALLPFLFIYPIMMGKDKRSVYFWAGFCAGLAIGTKYNNALILLPVILAHCSGRDWRKWFNWNIFLAFGATFLGFFVSSPYVFFHIPNFLTDIAAIVEHYSNRGHAGFEGDNNWWYYIQAMSYENLGVVVLGIAGIFLAFARHRKQEIVLLSFPMISYLQLSSYKVNFTRNLMPFVPFLALFAAIALVWLGLWGLEKVKFSRWQVPVLVGISLLVVVMPAITIAQRSYYNAQPTTRAVATGWIEANLPRGSKLWLEPFSVDLLPRNSYRLEGGKSVLTNPLEWYPANGYNYIVLSEAHYKGTLENGKPDVQATYRQLLDGQLPTGWSRMQDFKGNDTDKPGARITVISTGLKAIATALSDFNDPKVLPLRASLGGKVSLIGATYPESIAPGKTLSLILYWQTLDTMQQNFSVFVHVLDEKGNRVAQLDLPPLAGTRPTTTWQPGEIVRDEYPLTFPAELAPGIYQFSVGFYIAPNGSRLTLPDGGDNVIIGSVTVKK
jgi:4-amino-4-deoxy-L-arabinose transferase-like glycosyltransferase